MYINYINYRENERKMREKEKREREKKTIYIHLINLLKD